MATTTFNFRIPDCDLGNIEDCRSRALGVINDAEFDDFVRGLELNRVAATGAPAPRGGEGSVSCRADSGGGWSCEGRVGFRW
jgi:hypothetical protein